MAERRVVFVIKGGSSGTVRDWQLFVLSILALVKFFFCLHFFFWEALAAGWDRDCCSVVCVQRVRRGSRNVVCSCGSSRLQWFDFLLLLVFFFGNFLTGLVIRYSDR